MTIEERVLQLETELDNLRAMKQGAQGPPGNISVACAQATLAMERSLRDGLASTIQTVQDNLANTLKKVEDNLAETIKKVETTYAEMQNFKTRITNHVSDITRQRVERFNSDLQNEVTGIVVKTLEDYKVTSGLDGLPIRYGDTSTEQTPQ